jgi:hypothetical protein
LKLKPVLLLIAIGLLSLLSATPGDPHKVFWCHYPPGQWTGVPGDASHVIILSIDLAAQGPDSYTKHLGHSPSLNGETCDPTTFNGTTASGCAEGVSLDGTAASCPGGRTCGTATVGGGPTTVDLVFDSTNEACVCPVGTVRGGFAYPLNLPDAGDCGGPS